MSKKIIAVAAAAALALTALVGIAPASATQGALAITTTAGGTGTSADPYKINVPSENALVATTSTTTTRALTVTVSGLATGDVVRLDATGGFRILSSISALGTAIEYINVSTLGATTYSKTTTTNADVVVYAFTASNAAGTIVSSLTRTGLTSTNTLNVKGVAGAPVNISALSGAPTELANAATAATTFTVTDVFGNAVENNSTVIASASKSANMGTVTWDSTAKVYKSTMTSATSSTFLWDMGFTAAAVVGFPDAAPKVSGVVNYTGDSSLTAQVASLKSDYNKLATKYNKLVAKSKRVAKK
jgi:hypothetical protein